MKKIVLMLFIMLLPVALLAQDSKVSDLPELAAAPEESDILYIVDGGVSKKITVLNLLNALESALTGFEIHADNLPASSGTPGGNDTELQYNNSGSFAGIASWETDGTNILPVNGAKLHVKTTTTDHAWCIQAYDEGVGWADVVCFKNAATPTMELQSGATISGVGSLTLGGIALGDTTPDADGEIGYASNAYNLYANSEDLVLTASANTWTLSSGTGVTELNFSAINLVTTGTVSGAVPIITDNNGMTISAAQAYGSFFVASGAGTWNLPAAVAGMSICIYSTTAAAIVVNPDDSDVITLNGTALSAGDSITSSSGAGDFISLIAVSDSSWLTIGRSGTWTDTN